MSKPKVKLENWYKLGTSLIGDVVGHPKLGDLEDICTSTIINMDEANNTCETLNTIYELGKKYDGK